MDICKPIVKLWRLVYFSEITLLDLGMNIPTTRLLISVVIMC
jgi:hypothetical protein